jgi:glycosyltransferase involved in cell wall biosynthesis
MNILIIGDYPNRIGGVTNYTRPLALELSKNQEVFYLYNGASFCKFDFGKLRIEATKEFSEFNCFELKNGFGLEKNYDNLNVDTANWMDHLFADFIIKHEIQIIHINEIFGFSSSIIDVAKQQGVKVVITVHEYWWLCPHRVMVDYNNKICSGPNSIQKCGYCTQKMLNSFSSKLEKRKGRLRLSFPRIFHFMKDIYAFGKYLYPKKNDKTITLTFGTEAYDTFKSPKLESALEKRLYKNIHALNSANLIIGVSNDVKDKLTKFGVSPSKIIIQHIGSTIAANKIDHIKDVDTNNIVFGFIGGIGYYKGIHQLIDAFIKLPEEYKKKCSIELYGKFDNNYVNSINKSMLGNENDAKKIRFHGRYSPSEIPKISNTFDIMVLPSLCADTAPQTIFESFSCQLPVIAPRVGGFPDFITDKINGLLYTEASVDNLKEKLMYVIDNPKQISKFRSQIPALTTIAQNSEDLVKLYESLIIS